MPGYIGRDNTISAIVEIDRSLGQVNVEPKDIRTGKLSINSKGEKIIGTYTQSYLTDSTMDATATPADMNTGKTGYVKGVKITGNFSTLTADRYVIGTDRTYTAGESITAGRFIRVFGTTAYLVTSPSDEVSGIALTSATTGNTFTARIP